MNSLPFQPQRSEEAGPARRVAGVFRETTRALRARGLATPDLDARLLVCAACGISHEQFAGRPERPVGPDEYERIARLKARRLEGEPVSRLLGRREFRGLDFELTPQTLDPRPDTETAVEAVIELAGEVIEGGRAPAILDLGTGSGCILVSVLHHLESASGTGLDIDPAAAGTARANADRHGVGARAAFVCGSWLDSVSGRFDIVVSNPPYIPCREIDGLAAEVAGFDPRRALNGGSDGLDAYRAIAPRLKSVLRPGGWAVFETGAGQLDAVQRILLEELPGVASAEIRRWRDLSRRERCIGVRAPIERR